MTFSPAQIAEIRARIEHAVGNIPPCAIEVIDPQTGEPAAWFWFGRAELDVLTAILDGLDTAERNNALVGVSAQIMRWGRAEAATKRVWSFHDRKLREWKAAQYVLARAKPANADEKWKPPSEAAIEADYRRSPSYGPLNAAVERAEEAHTTARSVLSAWTTLGAMLARDGS